MICWYHENILEVYNLYGFKPLDNFDFKAKNNIMKIKWSLDDYLIYVIDTGGILYLVKINSNGKD